MWTLCLRAASDCWWGRGRRRWRGRSAQGEQSAGGGEVGQGVDEDAAGSGCGGPDEQRQSGAEDIGAGEQASASGVEAGDMAEAEQGRGHHQSGPGAGRPVTDG